MSDARWDPAQYERFRAERRQPFVDLVALIEPDTDLRVVDLGCGTGDLTAELHARLHARETVGIDSSVEMLARAQSLAGSGLRFEQADIATFSADRSFDLVLSNAALHWVPDHKRLLARLAAALAPGGQLAVQMPDNDAHASHRVAAEVAGEAPFADALGGWVRPRHVLAPIEYATLLHRLGFRRQIVRLAIYAHELGGTDDVVDWVKGTLMVEYLGRLPEPLREPFLARYRDRLRRAIGDRDRYLYTYERLLLWGRLEP